MIGGPSPAAQGASIFPAVRCWHLPNYDFFGLFSIMQNVFIDIEKQIDWKGMEKSLIFLLTYM